MRHIPFSWKLHFSVNYDEAIRIFSLEYKYSLQTLGFLSLSLSLSLFFFFGSLQPAHLLYFKLH